MKLWRVMGIVRGGTWIGNFEAETAEEAIRQASESDNAQITLCHHCARNLEVEVEDFEAEEVTGEEAGGG